MAEIVKEERNERGQVTYRKYSNGLWMKWQFDPTTGNPIYLELGNGSWVWRFYSNGNITLYEDKAEKEAPR